MSVIKFGTDGWRAAIAEDYTFQNVRVCSQAVAEYLLESGDASRGVVIGYDTRFASEHFAAAVAEVTAANGVRTYLCDRAAPTPAISYSILTNRAAGGVVITASHNPWTDNGFKYKLDFGASATPEVVTKLEGHIDRIEESGSRVQRMSLDEAGRRDLLVTFDPSPPYIEKIRSLLDVEGIRRAGILIVSDSMHGAGAGYLSALLAGDRTQVLEIRPERNPFFDGGGPEPITKNLGELIGLMNQGGHDVGLSTDGDADRLGVVDENGRFVSQLEVFALLALYLLEARGERGALVKSVTSTSMANILGRLYGVQVHEERVGFKYIGSKMIEVNALMGGEESGGFAFRGHIPERDGVVASLFMLDLMVKLKMKPSQLVDHLFKLVGPHYYDRVDFRLTPETRDALLKRLPETHPASLGGMAVKSEDTMDGFRYILEDGSWLLLRFSGTEPLLRIYTETDSTDKVKQLLSEGQKLAGV
ncbi:MAG: phosphoglucomutase/phosphomannomutase family protein [Dehalococcoidia bacterium]|nr:phosphoglucomutase/phosphomannomutase family protein [Dehalococcoidia bacterium]